MRWEGPEIQQGGHRGKGEVESGWNGERGMGRTITKPIESGRHAVLIVLEARGVFDASREGDLGSDSGVERLTFCAIGCWWPLQSYHPLLEERQPHSRPPERR